jgi:hypothetical protein
MGKQVKVIVKKHGHEGNETIRGDHVLVLSVKMIPDKKGDPEAHFDGYQSEPNDALMMEYADYLLFYLAQRAVDPRLKKRSALALHFMKQFDGVRAPVAPAEKKSALILPPGVEAESGEGEPSKLLIVAATNLPDPELMRKAAEEVKKVE